MLRVAAVFLVMALIAASSDSDQLSASHGKGRGSSFSSSPSSPCCLSWEPRTEGGVLN